MMTPNMQAVYDYVKGKYGYDVGIYNCRKISGSQTYSQHSWSNANDIYITDRITQDAVAADLRRTFGGQIRNVLTWRYNAAHWNHIHVDMWPKGYMTPPCKGGTLRVKHIDGSIGTMFTSDIGDDEMAILTDAEQVQLQKFLQELEGVNSNVSFVRYLIPWYRRWRSYGPEDFAGANADVNARDPEAHARLDKLHQI
jgi:hypothetical protein